MTGEPQTLRERVTAMSEAELVDYASDSARWELRSLQIEGLGSTLTAERIAAGLLETYRALRTRSTVPHSAVI